jgi:pyridinium-3,5-bisthiocarboxylic acid mononucleotide nickel chelatase
VRLLYLDVFAGLSGDMLLGALLDLGAPREPLDAAIQALGLEREVRLEISRVSRHQIAATRCRVVLQQPAPTDPPPATPPKPAPTAPPDHDHPPSHDHPHPHPAGALAARSVPARPYREIVRLLQSAPLEAAVRARAERAFALLAEAEAKVHALPTDQVEFHEVGAADSLVDFVGAAALVEALAPDRIVCSPIPLARAIGRSSHGAIPIPAPATINLLRGVPVVGQGGPDQTERVTPTGAALAVSLADSYGPIPAGRPNAIGYGAGQKEFVSVPNLVRLILLDAD